MNTNTRRIATLALASAAASIALAGPATAVKLPPPGPVGPHAVTPRAPSPRQLQPPVYNSNAWTRAQGLPKPATPGVASSGTDWAQVGYGAAGGIALAAAAGTSLVMLRRHQQMPHQA